MLVTREFRYQCCSQKIDNNSKDIVQQTSANKSVSLDTVDTVVNTSTDSTHPDR